MEELLQACISNGRVFLLRNTDLKTVLLKCEFLKGGRDE